MSIMVKEAVWGVGLKVINNQAKIALKVEHIEKIVWLLKHE